MGTPTPIGNFPPNATRMEPTDIAGVGNNTDESPSDSHDIPVSALRRSNADHDIESIQEDVNLISTLKDVNTRAKIKIQNFINGALKGGVDNAGVTHADKIRIDTNFDMADAEMISDLNQGGFELLNSKTIAEMQRGKGLHFNGVDQEVAIADDPNINFGTDDFSIRLSFRTSKDYSGGVGGIYNKGAGTELVSIRVGTDNKLQFIVRDSGSIIISESDGVVNDGDKKNIEVRCDLGGVLSITINGEHQTTALAAPAGSLTSTEPLYLGANDGPTSFFTGEIYEVLLLNYADTDDEAKSWSSNPLKQLEFKDIGGSQVAQNVSNCVNLTYTTFSGASATGFSATSNGAATHKGGTTDEIIFEKGKRYLVSFTLVLNSGAFPIYNIAPDLSSGGISDEGDATANTGSNLTVFTANSDTTGVIIFANLSESTDYVVSLLDIHQIGCIAEYRPDSLSHKRWSDKQNGNDGTVDAALINQPAFGEYTDRYKNYATDNNTFDVPAGTVEMQIIVDVITQEAATTLRVGTTNGGQEIVADVATTSTGLIVATMVLDNIRAGDTLFLGSDGGVAWSALDFDFYINYKVLEGLA